MRARLPDGILPVGIVTPGLVEAVVLLNPVDEPGRQVEIPRLVGPTEMEGALGASGCRLRAKPSAISIAPCPIDL